MDSQLLYHLALYLTPGIGNVHIKALISHCGSAEAVLKTPRGKLAKTFGIGMITASKIHQGNYLKEAEAELKKAEMLGVQIICFTDKRYPNQLKSIPDAPTILFVKGNIDFNTKKTIAIVGTRKATKYGKALTESIIGELALYNPIIISGLAYGIDIKAHTEALQQGLNTIAVMASGVDIIYPSAHKQVAKKIVKHGAIITENKFGTLPEPARFPVRNRIIAGMADATIVIEAGKKGGALITAEIANGYNRDVFALPGNVNHKYSEGCNDLIKNNKAHLITCVKDIAYIMGWDLKESSQDKRPITGIESLSPDEQLIVNLLSENINGLPIDLICIKSPFNTSKVASILLQLEFQGFIKSFPGKRYALSISL